MMLDLHEQFPQYGFDAHKGYCTPEHQSALDEHGPCVQHRFCYVNVRRAAGLAVVEDEVDADQLALDDEAEGDALDQLEVTV
jgi:ribonuclease HII